MAGIDAALLDARRALLTQPPLTSAHFSIRYGLRQVREGAGIGVDGVDGAGIVHTYLEALEALYRAVTSGSFVSPDCPFTPPACIPVYVFDTLSFTTERAPFWYFDPAKGESLLGLPSRLPYQLSREQMLQYARVTAVHEAAHAFTYAWRQSALIRQGRPSIRQRVPDLYWGRWQWLNEATALCLESLVYPESDHNLAYCLNWNDRPDVPLDHDADPYRGMLFVRYLLRSIAPDFLYRVWYNGLHNESAIEAIARLLEGTDTPLSAPYRPNLDLFTAYGLDSCFLADYPAGSFERRVYERFGIRMLACSFELAPGATKGCSGKVAPLAFRFYRLYPPTGSKRVAIRLLSEESREAPIRAVAAAATSDHRRAPGTEPVLLRRSSDDRSASAAYPCDRGYLDHILLVVAHPGPAGSSRAATSASVDCSYRLEVTADAG